MVKEETKSTTKYTAKCEKRMIKATIEDSDKESFLKRKILVWNVHGIKNLLDLSGSEKSRLVKNYFLICVLETWLTKDKLLLNDFKNYKYIGSAATKQYDKGRASGGIGMLIDENVVRNLEILDISLGWIVIRGWVDNNEWIFISIYVRPDSVKDRLLMFWELLWDIREKYDAAILISGDFNCRIGHLNNADENMLEDLNISYIRNSQDETICSNGKVLHVLMSDVGLCCINGRTSRDSRGEFTFINKNGKSVIDLTWSDCTGLKDITDFEIINLDTSDHLAQSISIERTPTKNEKENLNYKSPKENIPRINKYSWDASKRLNYSMKIKDKIKNCKMENMEVNFETIIELIKETAAEMDMVKNTGERKRIQFRNKPWFTKECREKKREVRRAYRKYKNSNLEESRIEYVDKKKNIENKYSAKRKEF